jgi:hypothetical protein
VRVDPFRYKSGTPQSELIKIKIQVKYISMRIGNFKIQVKYTSVRVDYLRYKSSIPQ